MTVLLDEHVESKYNVAAEADGRTVLRFALECLASTARAYRGGCCMKASSAVTNKESVSVSFVW